MGPVAALGRPARPRWVVLALPSSAEKALVNAYTRTEFGMAEKALVNAYTRTESGVYSLGKGVPTLLHIYTCAA
jgi:hypothetical protein